MEGDIWSHCEKSKTGEDFCGPGCWAIREGCHPSRFYLAYACPCGCDRPTNLPLCIENKKDHNWLWDGNRQIPTIKPSIRHLVHRPEDCNFHGFLTTGIWNYCRDGRGLAPNCVNPGRLIC